MFYVVSNKQLMQKTGSILTFYNGNFHVKSKISQQAEIWEIVVQLSLAAVVGVLRVGFVVGVVLL